MAKTVHPTLKFKVLVYFLHFTVTSSFLLHSRSNPFRQTFYHQSSSIYSNTNAANSTLLVSSPTTTTTPPATKTTPININLPAIHYTVPGFKVGWQDAEGNWYDEDGPRNGPPMNYWRQKSDERTYNRDITALSSLIAAVTVFQNDNNDNGVSSSAVNDIISSLERTNGVRRPMLSRKLLGQWAPIVLAGRKKVMTTTLTTSPKTPRWNGDVVEEIEGMAVPFTIDVHRAAGRKLAEPTVYGTFDAKLEVGEEVVVTTSDGVIHSSFVVDGTNENCLRLGVLSDGGTLRLGGVVYLSDYLLVTRGEDGEADFWLRCDDYYLGNIW